MNECLIRLEIGDISERDQQNKERVQSDQNSAGSEQATHG
jgi:hypothetical protein